MNDVRSRLIGCFSAVFPGLGAEEIPSASMASVGAWDSLATITLMSVIEEEFGISISPDDLSQLVSFDLALDYLRGKLDAS